VAADAVLFPLQQSALVPKIRRAVKTFYVNRGSKVHKGSCWQSWKNQILLQPTKRTKAHSNRLKLRT